MKYLDFKHEVNRRHTIKDAIPVTIGSEIQGWGKAPADGVQGSDSIIPRTRNSEPK